MFTATNYTDNLKDFNRSDAVKALVLYGIYIAVLCIQGALYTTDLSVGMLNSLQIIFPLILLAICMIFMIFSKQKLKTIGSTNQKLILSLISEIIPAVLLLIFIVFHSVISGHSNISLNFPSLTVLSLFAVGAIQEEIIFRGYIQTGLSAIINSPIIASCCTAFLFLLIHYPAHWIAGGFSLSVLSAFYVLILLILHFICDFVYKKNYLPVGRYHTAFPL